MARRPRGPDDGSPPIPPAIRTPRTTRSLAAALTEGSPGPSLRPHPAGPGPDAPTSARMSRIAVEGGVEAERTPRSTRAAGTASRGRGRPGPAPTNPRTASANASPAVAPVIVEDVDDGEEQRAADERPRGSEVARPGGRGEAAEQQLLADRRDDRAGDEVEGEPDRLARRGQRAVRRTREELRQDRPRRNAVTMMTGTAHSAPRQVVRARGSPSRAHAHLRPSYSAPVSTTSSRMSAT